MSAPNTPVATGTPNSPSALSEGVDQWRGVLGRRGVDPARSPSPHGVAVQRELTDHERGAARVEQRAVHHARVVVEHAQVRHLGRQLRGDRRIVGMRDAHEHAQTGADLADHRPSTATDARVTRCTKRALRLPAWRNLQEARKKLEDEFGQVRRHLQKIHESLDKVEKAGPKTTCTTC